MKILHIIAGLSYGGAESSLIRVITHLKKVDIFASIICLKNRSDLSQELDRLGIPTLYLNLGNPIFLILAPFRIAIFLLKEKPNLIQGWLYHGNVMAFFLKQFFFLGRVKMCWGIRNSATDLNSMKKSQKLLVRFLGLASHSPDAIIYNSHFSATNHLKYGYSQKESHIIQNGFSTDFFVPQGEPSLREKLNLENEAFIVGHVGRFHPMKDHHTFIVAAKIALKKKPSLHFVLIGHGVDPLNSQLSALLDSDLERQHFHFLGPQKINYSIYSSFDLFCLSSCSESFPNVIGEAMACGVPCVSTQVGDAAHILGDTGTLVEDRNPTQLAQAILDNANQDLKALKKRGALARERIRSLFSIEKEIARFIALYKSLFP